MVMVAFNSHWRGHAVKNARRLRELLGEGDEGTPNAEQEE